MPDFPSNAVLPNRSVLSTCGLMSGAGAPVVNSGGTLTAGAVWPAANRAIYVPVAVETRCTAYQMSFTVATQSGNYDIGIYDVTGKRLVSKGSTAVPAAGFALADITDTDLSPGVYFLALNVDNTTASIFRGSSLNGECLRSCGVQQQAVGAIALPSTATFANPASSYVPLINAHLKSTV